MTAATVNRPQRTSGLEWIVVSLVALVLPPIGVAWAFYRATQHRYHEWLAWWTVLVVSIALTVGFGIVVASNGWSLR